MLRQLILCRRQRTRYFASLESDVKLAAANLGNLQSLCIVILSTLTVETIKMFSVVFTNFLYTKRKEMSRE